MVSDLGARRCVWGGGIGTNAHWPCRRREWCQPSLRRCGGTFQLREEDESGLKGERRRKQKKRDAMRCERFVEFEVEGRVADVSQAEGSGGGGRMEGWRDGGMEKSEKI